ncbi:UDP-N-acetylmuramoyl-tripeptide--D-alanyl-D-alanine ligase [Arthrospira platensis BEA 1257B]
MSELFTLTQLLQILTVNGEVSCDVSNNFPVIGITTDTRTLQRGEVFVALQGDRFDGHDFVVAAIAKGALCAVVNREFAVSHPEFPLIPVADTLRAYQTLARSWRDRFSIPIIGVTGSVGKTTTKELISAVLSHHGKVHKTFGNYNNEIGVPKTLLELRSDHDFAVIEMAMRGPGEIADLTRIARPTVGVIVNVGTAHIVRLGSEDAIARAKCELLAEMPDTSIAVLNHDNRRLMSTATQVWSGTTITYGLEGGILQGELLGHETIRVAGIELPLPLPGSHNASNFLAALAVLRAIAGWETSAEELYAPLSTGLSLQMPQGRAKRYHLAQDILLLDETYNAGLESTLAALKLLAETPGNRHIAVLGTMKELGERSLEFHQQVGAETQRLNLDGLFILADLAEAQAMAEGAMVIDFIDIQDLGSPQAHQLMIDKVLAFLKPGDRVLFKASNSVGMNRVVEGVRSQLIINH